MSIYINFDVFSNTPTHLYVMDLSDWDYAEDLPAYIQITTPGSKKPKSYSFIKHKTNIFNSHNLGLSCLSADCTGEDYTDLPDGIYCIKVLSGYEGIDQSKYYLKTDRFEIEYKKILASAGVDNVDQTFINYMTKIKYVLEVAKSHTMNGNFAEANRYFQEAKKMLKKHAECKDCI
jgi:hypothetical protein